MMVMQILHYRTKHPSTNTWELTLQNLTATPFSLLSLSLLSALHSFLVLIKAKQMRSSLQLVNPCWTKIWMESHEDMSGIIELQLERVCTLQEAFVQILPWLFINVHDSARSQCVCMSKLSWELAVTFYLLVKRGWHTNLIHPKGLKFLLTLTLQAVGTQQIMAMLTIFIREQDLLFDTQAVLSFGKASYKQRLLCQQLGWVYCTFASSERDYSNYEFDERD